MHTYINRAERLNKCLSSIFNQIGNDMEYEIIVSDNCSEDNTAEIVSYYSNQFDNILYFKNEVNIGEENFFLLSATRVNGKFIFLHGDDDYFKAGCLNTILNSIKNDFDSGLVFIDVRKNDNNTSLIDQKLFFDFKRIWSKKFDYHPNDIIKFLKELGYQCFIIKNGNLSSFDKVTEETTQTNFVFLHTDSIS